MPTSWPHALAIPGGLHATVTIFAPGIGGYGAAKFYELVFERERR